MYIYLLMLVIATLHYFYFSYTKYYKGKMSDHFDGLRFSELNNDEYWLDCLK